MMTNHGLSSSAARLLLLLLLAFLLLHGAPSSRAADTIVDGQPLYGGQSLVSKRGKFRLGFFQPGTVPTATVFDSCLATDEDFFFLQFPFCLKISSIRG
jgi:hypothetical protein